MEFTLINKAVNICAKRNSGKSELVKYLVKQEMNAFDKIFVFSSTEPMNKFYQKYIPKNNIFSEFSEQWLERLYKRMTELKDQDKNYNVLIIFDDVNDDLHESKMIKKLYTTGRHLNLACIVICQYVNQLPPICRTNCDYMLIGQTIAICTTSVKSGFYRPSANVCESRAKPEFRNSRTRAINDFALVVHNSFYHTGGENNY